MVNSIWVINSSKKCKFRITHSVMQWTRGKWRKVLQKYFRKILQRIGLAKYKILSETDILITDTGEK